jgi:hypothetical protein
MGAGRPVSIVEVEARACPLRQLQEMRVMFPYLPSKQGATLRPPKL